MTVLQMASNSFLAQANGPEVRVLPLRTGEGVGVSPPPAGGSFPEPFPGYALAVFEPKEDQAFRDVVAQLLIDDMAFARRIERPPLRWAVLAVLMWTIAPICIVVGGWTGLIEAVLAAGYGSYLMRKRKRWAEFIASGPR